MEGTLKIVEYGEVNPREKYFVLHKDQIHRVLSLKKDKIQLEFVDKPVGRNEITPVKLKVKIDKRLCDLLFDDYDKLKGDLKEGMTLNGRIIKFKQKPSEGDTVIVSSLRIVDKYGLYDHNSRYGKIHSIEPTHHIILMNKDNMEVRCRRSDYKIVNIYDEQNIFHIPCDTCGQ